MRAMLLRFVAQNRSGMIKSIFIEGVVHNRCHALLIIKENDVHIQSERCSLEHISFYSQCMVTIL